MRENPTRIWGLRGRPYIRTTFNLGGSLFGSGVLPGVRSPPHSPRRLCQPPIHSPKTTSLPPSQRKQSSREETSSTSCPLSSPFFCVHVHFPLPAHRSGVGVPVPVQGPPTTCVHMLFPSTLSQEPDSFHLTSSVIRQALSSTNHKHLLSCRFSFKKNG